MTILGPDLSHYQGSVDFSKLRTLCPFVIIKATQGTGIVDSMFTTNRSRSRSAGLVRGMYHFAGTAGADGKIRVGSAQAEAALFLSTVGQVGADEFLVLDFEATDPPANPAAWCSDFLGWIVGRTGVVPMLYINQSTRDRYDWSPVIARGAPLWLAKYDGSSTDATGSPGRWPRVAMEQFTDCGSVPGVSAPCDVNVFFGTLADMMRLGRKTPAPVPVPAPAPMMEDEKMLMIRNSKGTVALISGQKVIPVPGDGSYAGLVKAGVQTADLTDSFFDTMIKRLTS